MTSVSISIDVPDLDQAQAFYCKALGCEFKRDDNQDIRVLSTDSVDIYLLARSSGSLPVRGSRETRTYERHWCPIHLDFGATDIREATRAIEAHGGTVEGSDSGSWGEIAYCADPFGNGFCLIKE